MARAVWPRGRSGRRCPDVLLLPAPLPPMIWAALGRVRVLLPAGLVERLDDEQLAALLAHELAHVRRGDHWVRRLEFIVLGLYWWYPLAWWARTRLQAEEEECCDAWVVEALPAHAYASAIVATVDFLANDLAPVPVLASGLGRLDGLKRRLTLILTGTAPKRLNLAGRLAVLVLGLALLPLLPTLARSQKKPDEPASNPEAVKVEDADPRDEALAFRPNPLNLTGGENEVAALAVSGDGRYLAAGTGYVNRPGEVRVWTIPDHKEVLVYATAQGVATVAFSRDGKYLASCGYEGQAVVREFPSGKVVCVLPLDGAARLSFAPDGETLVTVTESRTIKVWNTATAARDCPSRKRCVPRLLRRLFARRQVAGRRRRRHRAAERPQSGHALGHDDVEAGRQIGRPYGAGHVGRVLGGLDADRHRLDRHDRPALAGGRFQGAGHATRS